MATLFLGMCILLAAWIVRPATVEDRLFGMWRRAVCRMNEMFPGKKEEEKK